MKQLLLSRCILAGLLLAPLPAIERPEDVSLVQLIARPEQYDGRLVNVIGYLSLDREYSALYLHKEDFDHSLLSNAVSLHPSEAMLRDKRDLSPTYVVVIGIFRAGEKGRSDPSVSGGITEIKGCRVWTTGRAGADARP